MLQVDTLPNYSFINFKKNQLLLPDSSSLNGFFKKLWQFETEGKGKVDILHVGDSHIQGGFFTEEVRKNFHENFGCATKARGFIFPYNVAQSNAPRNYTVNYTGSWTGCRSAFEEQRCSWGIAGFSTSSTDDSLSLSVSAAGFDQDYYQFSEFTIFLEYDTASYSLEVLPSKGVVVAQAHDTAALAYKYFFSELADSVRIQLTRKVTGSDSVVLHGFSLENELPGITYSEAAVNGGKVSSFLASEHFLSQLKYLSPNLLILSLGTNDGYSNHYTDSSFQAQYDFLLYQLKFKFPLLEILLTTPGDANRHYKVHIEENARIRKIILKLAKKYQCAVWDWYSIMGGSGSVEKWKNNGLSSVDRVHLNQKGYRLQGKLLYNAIIKRYERGVNPNRSNSIILNHGKNWKQFWAQFYEFSDKTPLLFNSPVFWTLFTCFLLLYLFLFKNTKIRSWYLLIFSLFFYYKTGGWYFSILLFSTVLDFYVGKFIRGSVKEKTKKFWLFTSIGINIGMLVFFKYSHFLIGTCNDIFGTNFHVVNIFGMVSNSLFGTEFSLSKIILPVGISFYTFQTMSYAIDIYRGKIEPLNNIVDFGFYVCFFPQLVAGPIVRASEFIPQIHSRYQLTKEQFVRATVLIMGGLIKKGIISDYISVNYVDKIFDAPLRYSGFENLLGVYAYSLQIYCDFSAYSDIAIGLALLLGFTLPDNFNAPYLASNITDFWRRWHISLSKWLRDYVYISFGGNRKGKIRTIFNLMITMLIGGLWHGASFRFIIWGGLHGLGLVIHKFFMQLFPKLSASKNWLIKYVSWSLTFHFVSYCWLFFRAKDLANYYDMMGQIKNVFYDWSTNEWTNISHYTEVLIGYKYVMLLLALGYVFHLTPPSWEAGLKKFLMKVPLVLYPIGILLITILLFQFSEIELTPFIYFQF